MTAHVASRGRIALLCFFAALTSRELARFLPPDIAVTAWKLTWVLFCFAGLWLAYRMGPYAAVTELGLTGRAAKGIGVALLASLPMLVALFVLGDGTMLFEPKTFVSSVGLAAVTEEILFRGYLFRQLYRRAGWRFVPAVSVTGGLFGLAHIGSASRGDVLEMLGVAAITALGGAFFAWLFVRWGDNLWVPIGMHLFMNAWWELFAVGADAIGTPRANAARALAIGSAIAITFRCTRGLPEGAPISGFRVVE